MTAAAFESFSFASTGARDGDSVGVTKKLGGSTLARGPPGIAEDRD